MKKIEIIARITEDSGATIENPLMVWHDDGDHEGYPFLSSTLTYPGLEFRLHQRRVLRNGKDVKLSRYEYGVLVFLAQRPGWLCSKEQIFENVWGNCYGDIGTVAVNIKNLREKIDPNNKYIITI